VDQTQARLAFALVTGAEDGGFEPPRDVVTEDEQARFPSPSDLVHLRLCVRALPWIVLLTSPTNADGRWQLRPKLRPLASWD
jgi:hypothetical protein